MDLDSLFIINQSISQNLYSAPSRSLLGGAPDQGQAEKNSLEKVVEIENRHRLGGALDLLEVRPRLLDQPQKMNCQIINKVFFLT